MRRLAVVVLAVVAAAACSPSAAGAPGGGDGGGTVDLPADTVSWCGQNMRAVYKSGTEINANPGIDELNREVLAAGLEGREIDADTGNRLRDEWITMNAASFSRACQRAFDARR